MKEIGGNIYEEWMTTDYQKNYKPEGRRNIGRQNGEMIFGRKEQAKGS